MWGLPGLPVYESGEVGNGFSHMVTCWVGG